MAKERMFICHGRHRLMKTQAHKPKGWTQELIYEPGFWGHTVWFCPECQKKRREVDNDSI